MSRNDVGSRTFNKIHQSTARMKKRDLEREFNASRKFHSPFIESRDETDVIGNLDAIRAAEELAASLEATGLDLRGNSFYSLADRRIVLADKYDVGGNNTTEPWDSIDDEPWDSTTSKRIIETEAREQTRPSRSRDSIAASPASTYSSGSLESNSSSGASHSTSSSASSADGNPQNVLNRESGFDLGCIAVSFHESDSATDEPQASVAVVPAMHKATPTRVVWSIPDEGPVNTRNSTKWRDQALEQSDTKRSDQSIEQSGSTSCKSRDRLIERSASKSRDRSIERNASKSRDQSIEQSASRSHDRSRDRSVSKARDQSIDRSTSRSLDRSIQGSATRSLDRSIQGRAIRSLDRSIEESASKSLDRSIERSASKSRDRSIERSASKSRDRSMEKSRSQSRDRSMERSRSQSRDRTTERSRGKSRDRSVTRNRSKSRDRSIKRKRRKSRNRSIKRSSGKTRTRSVERTGSKSLDRSIKRHDSDLQQHQVLQCKAARVREEALSVSARNLKSCAVPSQVCKEDTKKGIVSKMPPFCNSRTTEMPHQVPNTAPKRSRRSLKAITHTSDESDAAETFLPRYSGMSTRHRQSLLRSLATDVNTTVIRPKEKNRWFSFRSRGAIETEAKTDASSTNVGINQDILIADDIIGDTSIANVSASGDSGGGVEPETADQNQDGSAWALSTAYAAMSAISASGAAAMMLASSLFGDAVIETNGSAMATGLALFEDPTAGNDNTSGLSRDDRSRHNVSRDIPGVDHVRFDDSFNQLDGQGDHAGDTIATFDNAATSKRGLSLRRKNDKLASVTQLRAPKRILLERSKITPKFKIFSRRCEVSTPIIPHNSLEMTRASQGQATIPGHSIVADAATYAAGIPTKSLTGDIVESTKAVATLNVEKRRPRKKSRKAAIAAEMEVRRRLQEKAKKDGVTKAAEQRRLKEEAKKDAVTKAAEQRQLKEESKKAAAAEAAERRRLLLEESKRAAAEVVRKRCSDEESKKVTEAKAAKKRRAQEVAKTTVEAENDVCDLSQEVPNRTTTAANAAVKSHLTDESKEPATAEAAEKLDVLEESSKEAATKAKDKCQLPVESAKNAAPASSAQKIRPQQASKQVPTVDAAEKQRVKTAWRQLVVKEATKASAVDAVAMPHEPEKPKKNEAVKSTEGRRQLVEAGKAAGVETVGENNERDKSTKNGKDCEERDAEGFHEGSFHYTNRAVKVSAEEAGIEIESGRDATNPLKYPAPTAQKRQSLFRSIRKAAVKRKQPNTADSMKSTDYGNTPIIPTSTAVIVERVQLHGDSTDRDVEIVSGPFEHSTPLHMLQGRSHSQGLESKKAVATEAEDKRHPHIEKAASSKPGEKRALQEESKRTSSDSNAAMERPEQVESKPAAAVEVEERSRLQEESIEAIAADDSKTNSDLERKHDASHFAEKLRNLGKAKGTFFSKGDEKCRRQELEKNVATITAERMWSETAVQKGASAEPSIIQLNEPVADNGQGQLLCQEKATNPHAQNGVKRAASLSGENVCCEVEPHNHRQERFHTASIQQIGFHGVSHSHSVHLIAEETNIDIRLEECPILLEAPVPKFHGRRSRLNFIPATLFRKEAKNTASVEAVKKGNVAVADMAEKLAVPKETKPLANIEAAAKSHLTDESNEPATAEAAEKLHILQESSKEAATEAKDKCQLPVESAKNAAPASSAQKIRPQQASKQVPTVDAAEKQRVKTAWRQLVVKEATKASAVDAVAMPHEPEKPKKNEAVKSTEGRRQLVEAGKAAGVETVGENNERDKSAKNGKDCEERDAEGFHEGSFHYTNRAVKVSAEEAGIEIESGRDATNPLKYPAPTAQKRQSLFRSIRKAAVKRKQPNTADSMKSTDYGNTPIIPTSTAVIVERVQLHGDSTDRDVEIVSGPFEHSTPLHMLQGRSHSQGLESKKAVATEAEDKRHPHIEKAASSKPGEKRALQEESKRTSSDSNAAMERPEQVESKPAAAVEVEERSRLQEESIEAIAADDSKTNSDLERKHDASHFATKANVAADKVNFLEGTENIAIIEAAVAVAEKLRVLEETKKTATAKAAEKRRQKEESKMAVAAEKRRQKEEAKKAAAAEDAEKRRKKQESKKAAAAAAVEKRRQNEESKKAAAVEKRRMKEKSTKAAAAEMSRLQEELQTRATDAKATEERRRREAVPAEAAEKLSDDGNSHIFPVSTFHKGEQAPGGSKHRDASVFHKMPDQLTSRVNLRGRNCQEGLGSTHARWDDKACQPKQVGDGRIVRRMFGPFVGPFVGMLKEHQPHWGPSMDSMSEDSSTEKSASNYQTTASEYKLPFLTPCAGCPKPNTRVGDKSPEKGDEAIGDIADKDSEIQSLEEKLRAYSSCFSASTFRFPRVNHESQSNVPDVFVQESVSGSLASSALTMESREDGFFSFFQHLLKHGDELTSEERSVSNQGMHDSKAEGVGSKGSDDDSANTLPVDNTLVEIREAVRILKMHASRLGVSEDQLFKTMIEKDRQLRSRRKVGS